MLWFISAFIIASAIFLFAPKEVTEQANNDSAKKSEGHIGLFILPVIVLAWLLFTLIDGDQGNFSAAAIGFVLTSCAIAHTKFHKFIIPCAAITVVSLIVGLTLTL
ncbi:hypothetical protein [Shewanella sp. UCD-KL12]|uniref:hypothetical protein n=1 Tax=Shewanella sp. UCD-KL12 TaxID=1917163 RepID=UPI000970B1A5|nr:hypothetical protein [Shewanella sp. UCD-KL12]